MNKRQWKKANKKADMWVGLDTIPYRCRYCYNFESGDMTVGFFDACVANYLYDKNGDYRENMYDKESEYLSRKGWTCPHFRPIDKAKKMKLHPLKQYSEIKKSIETERKFFESIIIDKKGELMFNKNTKKIEINGERETKHFVAGEGYVSKAEYDRVEAYKAFMYNPDNVRNCLECPENIGNSSNLPCGQQNCWVSCHCNN